jgi:hypothetical protein
MSSVVFRPFLRPEKKDTILWNITLVAFPRRPGARRENNRIISAMVANLLTLKERKRNGLLGI